MNPIQDLINNLQNLVTQVPEFIQPLVVGLAEAVLLMAGEGASPIGVIGGINPIIAAIAAATGTLIVALIVVLVSSRARVAVVSCRADRR